MGIESWRYVVVYGVISCLLGSFGATVVGAADSSNASTVSVLGADATGGTGNSGGWWESVSNIGDAIARGGPAGPLLGDHSELLGDFHITGFLQNQSGMWVNSEAIRYNKSKNSLATERNWTQIDTNWNYGPNSLFVRFWGVYEPAYPYEEATPHFHTDFYNQYGVHDAWYRYKQGPFTLFLGRQIVIWGESISFRVGDVINPQDLSFAFGFANLEQSRLPVWMVHPLIELPDLGPLTSNDIEVVFVPGLQPLYTNVGYSDHRTDQRNNVAGIVNILPPPGGRFMGRPYPFVIPAQLPKGSPRNLAAFPQVTAGLGRTHWYYPPATWENAEEGVRFHTFTYDSELTAFYWHSHQISPTPYVSGIPGHQFLSFRFPGYNDVGVTGNRPVYLPASMVGQLLSQAPFVMRGEAVFQDRTPINTQALSQANAVDFSSTLNTLVALDLSSAYAPWLTSTGTLTNRFEWNNFTIVSPSRFMVYPVSAMHRYHNDENLLESIGTSWWWGSIAPTLTGIYNPDGTTFEFFPDLLLTPPWSNKYTLDLKYIGILGNKKYGGAGGVFKGKSMFVMTFQYNFNLL